MGSRMQRRGPWVAMAGVAGVAVLVAALAIGLARPVVTP